MSNPIVTKQINLNSVNAIKKNGTYNSDVLFPFKNMINEDEQISHIDFSIENAQIPVSFYNITTNNNTLGVSVDGGGVNILTIPEGNYNTTTLNTEIINQLADAGITTITLALSTVTGKYTFTISSGYFTFHYANSTMLKILGFLETQDYTSSSQILTSPYPVNLLGVLKMKISSNAISVMNFDSADNGSTKNTILELPITAQSFGLITYTNVSNIHSNLLTKNINDIDIRITDNNDSLINFNNIDWTMSFLIKIYYKDKKVLVHQKPENEEIKETPESEEIKEKPEPKPKKKEIDDMDDNEILFHE